MKSKLCLALCILAPLLTCCTAKQIKIEKSDIIVDKTIRQEIDNLATWFWDIPQTKNTYYFTLEQHGDMKVEKTTYEKYKIGDTYTWEEVAYE